MVRQTLAVRGVEFISRKGGIVDNIQRFKRDSKAIQEKCFYFTVRKGGKIAKTKHVACKDEVNIDLDKNNRVVGIEVIQE